MPIPSVLVVEDEATIAAVLVELLAGEGLGKDSPSVTPGTGRGPWR